MNKGMIYLEPWSEYLDMALVILGLTIVDIGMQNVAMTVDVVSEFDY